MPFVQGQLRRESVAITIESECAHCHKRLHLEIDSELNYRVAPEAAKALVFVPIVNFEKLRAKSIIDDF